MRLPGTFNLGGRNQLPTAEFLIHFENLKRAKERARLEREANGSDKAEFGDKPCPKRVTSTSKKANNNNDAKKGEKPGDVVLTPDGETFTKVQDETIIRMKMEQKTWAMIGAEIGKEKGAVSHRFKEIKPSDFDVKEKEWKEKNGGGTGGQNQGKPKNQGGNNQNENKNQNQNQGGKGNNTTNTNQQNNQQQGGKNKNKQNQNQHDHQNNNNQHWKNKKEEAQAEAAAEFTTTPPEDETWAVPDENFTEKEVTILEKIVEIELRNAFVRIAKSFAGHPDGKRVHPDSIAMKVLGEGLDLSSLGGAS